MRRVQQGVSLVELMIGIAIGLVLVAAMITIYVRQAQSYRQLEALSRMQENARYAFEIMGRDIRMAGNWTCNIPGQTNAVNFLNDPANAWWSYTARPLFGVEETADSDAVGDAGFPADFGGNARRGDAVMVVRADNEAKASIVGGGYDLGTNAITLTSGTQEKGDLLVLTDCQNQTVVFQMSDDSDINNTTVEHVQGVSPTPGNCKAHLFGTTCAQPHNPIVVNGAKVMPLLAHAYYVRNSPRRYANSTDNIPSLYRQVLDKDADGNVTTTAEELVDGIIDMQVLYGVDTDATADRQINEYQTATDITNGTGWPAVPGLGTAEERWQRALAVRVTLAMESTEDGLATADQTFTYGNGATVTDRRLRRQFTATYGIRGRLD